jgi:hypothetical protein
MSTTCLSEGSSSGRLLYIQVWYRVFYMNQYKQSFIYYRLPEEGPLGAKHVEEKVKRSPVTGPMWPTVFLEV